MYRITLSNNPRKDGTYSIIIRVYDKGSRDSTRVDKRITVKTLPCCSKKDWNFDAEQYTKSFKNNDALYNNMIKKLKEKCEKIYKALLKDSVSPSAEAFVSFYNNYDSLSNRLYMSNAIAFKIKRLEKNNKWSTARVYTETLRRWDKFVEDEYNCSDIPIGSLSELHLKKFTDFLLRGRGKGGVRLRIRTLKTCFLAMKNENLIPADVPSPFDKFDYSVAEQDSKAQTPLSKEQWLKLKAYQPESLNRAFWKDVFMMMVYGQGINLKDLMLLTPANIIDVRDQNGETVQAIRYVRSKTKGKRKNATIEIYYSKELKALIEKYHTPHYEYLVPIVEMNSLGKVPAPNTEKWFNILIKCRLAFNFQLRMIAKDLELPNHFSNYAARHTFASLLFWEGVDVRVISQALGHKTQEMTHEYLAKLDLVTMKDNIKGIL